jgi:hypothetical protein
MPPALVLLPPALLAAAAAVCCGLGWARASAAPPVAAAGAWLGAAAAGAIWTATGRVPMELELTRLTPTGPPVGLRLDAVSVLFLLLVLVPSGLLLAFQRRTAWQCALTVLAALAATVALEADDLVLAVIAFATCVTVLNGLVRGEDEEAGDERAGGWRPFSLSLQPAWMLLLWAAVVVQVASGTTTYSAVPVTALTVPVFLALAAVAVLTAGALPWGAWTSLAWRRPRPEAASAAVALAVPLGFVLLLRAYGLGGGRWPSYWLNLALAALGAAVALAAAYRAQAAPGVRECLGEAVPMAAGLALLSLAVGTAAGIDAALVALAGGAVVTGLAPLLPGAPRGALLCGLGVAAGLPPALLFAGWLLAVQGALGAGAAFPLLGLAGAAAWLLWVAAVARGLRLPAAQPVPPSPAGRVPGGGAGAWTGVVLALVAGLASALIEAVLALPATGEVVQLPPALTTGVQLPVSLPLGVQLPVAQPSGGWSPLLLGLPLLVLLVILTLVARRLAPAPLADPAAAGAPPPLLATPRPVAGAAGAASGRLADASRILAPALALVQRRWLFPAIDALRDSRPWLWTGITLALVLLVTR